MIEAALFNGEPATQAGIQGSHGVRSLLLRSILRLVRLNGLSVQPGMLMHNHKT
jgi:hypothetical protein